jgi:hypothetical protein
MQESIFELDKELMSFHSSFPALASLCSTMFMALMPNMAASTQICPNKHS